MAIKDGLHTDTVVMLANSMAFVNVWQGHFGYLSALTALSLMKINPIAKSSLIFRLLLQSKWKVKCVNYIKYMDPNTPFILPTNKGMKVMQYPEEVELPHIL